jgi:hypothetical protein
MVQVEDFCHCTESNVCVNKRHFSFGYLRLDILYNKPQRNRYNRTIIDRR